MANITIKTNDRFEAWVGKTNQLATGFGDLDDLPAGTDSVVEGINSAMATVGNLGDLETEDSSDLVSALNEVKRRAIIMALTLATPLN
jgi:hypothetical protein